MYLLPPDYPDDVIRIGFCRARGIFSRAIEWFGAGYFSHVTTLLPGSKNVIDSRLHGGVRIRPISSLESDTIFWVDLICDSTSQRTHVIDSLKSQLGKPYDQIAIWDFVTGSIQRRNWRDTRSWFCDELAVWSWCTAGLREWPLLPLTRIDPGGSFLIAGQGPRRLPHAFSVLKNRDHTR